MKKKLIIGCVLIVLIGVVIFNFTGNVLKVETKEVSSEVFTNSEINEAISVVKRYFFFNFSSCTLLEIEYVGDTGNTQGWANQYNADQSIVLTSSFDVGFNGGSLGFSPNTSENGWRWILTRNDGGSWKLQTWGY